MSNLISAVECCDCIDFMKRFPDKYFGLALIDTNYGIDQGGDKNYTRGKLAISKKYHSFSDNKSPNKEYFDLLILKSINQIIFGANHFISKIPYDSSCWLVWDKDNGDNDFADCELAWTSFDSAVRIFKFRWNGMLQENMKEKEKRIHPTQKPIALYRWTLKNYAKEGDKILDTHMGSQSSRIAAYQMGFDYWGCEIDEEYFEEGNKRFKLVTSQLSLF